MINSDIQKWPVASDSAEYNGANGPRPLDDDTVAFVKTTKPYGH